MFVGVRNAGDGVITRALALNTIENEAKEDKEEDGAEGGAKGDEDDDTCRVATAWETVRDIDTILRKKTYGLISDYLSLRRTHEKSFREYRQRES